ncbi:MAG: PQQ-binding-like beta-propeller repeat protein [Phycisphaerae bacterium]|nr:PQQ-binding-like beta-propeller repeat protein [Tepidisphaeraceae bacterium]
MPTRALLILALFASLARADDWPQYRGPNRDDVSKESGLLKSWPAGGPKLLWAYADTGAGYSGPAIVGQRLFITGARGESEFLIGVDVSAAEPKQLWATRVGPTLEWKGNVWSSGPSATPTVDGDLVYALGGNGDLLCASAADGKEVWRSNLPTDLAAEVNPIGGGPKKLGWGFTSSPLVDGDRLICLPGGPKGTVAALDKRTGKVLWRSTELTDQAAYTSPMLAEIAGVRQYVVLTNQSIAGVAADSGKLLWSVKRKFGTEVINSPIVRGNHVFVTVGAGGGCELLKIDKAGDALAASVVYSNKNLVNHHGNVVLLGDHLYGHSQGRGWTGLNFATGEPAWAKREGPRAGATTYADGAFYQLAESDGTVTLTAASPTETKDLGKFKLPQPSKLKKPKGGLWTPPVVANGRLYLRDQELLFCYDVKDAK